METKREIGKISEEKIAGKEKENSSIGEKIGKSPRRKRMTIIFGAELLLILVMGVVLYLVMSYTDTEGPKRVELVEEELEIPKEIVEAKEEGTCKMKGYMNIVLFGVDAKRESELYKGSRSDSTMIASINLDTGDIRLVSVYRDTYLNIGT